MHGCFWICATIEMLHLCLVDAFARGAATYTAGKPSFDGPARSSLSAVATTDPLLRLQAVRELVAPVPEFCRRHKNAISMFSTTNLICIMWMTLSSAQHIMVQQKFTSVLLVVVAAALIHIFNLLCNSLVVWCDCFQGQV